MDLTGNRMTSDSDVANDRLITPTGVSPADDEAAEERSPMLLTVPVWLDRLAAWSWRLLVIGGFAFALLWAVSWIRLAVVPTLIAMVFASALRPVVKAAASIGLPRTMAVVVILVTMFVLIVAGLLYAGQQVAGELDQNTMQTEAIREEIERRLGSEPFNLSSDQIREAETAIRDALVGGVRAWGSNSGGLVATLAGGLVLASVLTFLFLKDGSAMWRWLLLRVSPLRRTSVDRAGRSAVDTMAGYLRSVLIAGIVDAVLIGIVLALLGVPLVLPLMFLTFLAALFPVVGAVVAGLAATIVALVTVGPQAAAWMALAALVIQQLEGNVVLPLVAGQSLSLHPAAILFALTAGGAIAGLAGAFLAVPVVAGLVSATASISADRHAELVLPTSAQEPDG